MMWIVYALCAAVLWGAGYLLYELMLRTVSASGILLSTSIICACIYTCWGLIGGTLGQDWLLIKKGGNETKLLGGIILTTCLANATFLASMRLKNATIAGLIEITYPLFTALFAWYFVREAQMSMGTFFGAMLIMAGIICISYFERSV